MNRKPYTGPTSKLVIAYDVGTTFSGASYCFLDPGEVPVVRSITRYPGQENIAGATKIPTILYYDESGTVQAAGAEAMNDEIEQQAQDNGWHKAEWFKLHFRPNTRSSADVTQKIPPLPKGKTVVQVFADFLRYLHACARAYIEESNVDGLNKWKRLEPTIQYVLSHPNGWEGGQQALMRMAAIQADLIPDTGDGRSRLFFVTEGEASLHFCIECGLASEATANGKGIIVVDAGGGTIDISAYRRTSLNPQTYEEIAAAKCAFQGSVFVTQNAREHLEKLLIHSHFKRQISDMTRSFDQRTKMVFGDSQHSYAIKFGGKNDNDNELNIQSGQLRHPGSVVAGFFERPFSTIMTLVHDLCKDAKEDISTVFLVGGFAANKWLYENLKTGLTSYGLDVCRPDAKLSKAVTDGAVSYHVDHWVNVRVAKNFYGIKNGVSYIDSDPEHVSRRGSLYIDVAGGKRIGGHFSVIVSKGTKVSETQEFRKSFSRIRKTSNDQHLNIIRIRIHCYRGSRENPRWFDQECNMYSTLCEVQADLSHVPKQAKSSVIDGSHYYRIEFDVVLSFGLTEFKAYLGWKENGVEKRSVARLIYDPDMFIGDLSNLDGRD